MKVTIEVTGGDYADVPSWTGNLSDAPATHLIPEGIVSARTTEEAASLRKALADLLGAHDRVVLSAVRWSVEVTRAVDDVYDVYKVYASGSKAEHWGLVERAVDGATVSRTVGQLWLVGQPHLVEGSHAPIPGLPVVAYRGYLVLRAGEPHPERRLLGRDNRWAATPPELRAVEIGEDAAAAEARGLKLRVVEPDRQDRTIGASSADLDAVKAEAERIASEGYAGCEVSVIDGESVVHVARKAVRS